MGQDLWTTVDVWLADRYVPDDPVLSAALQDSAAAGLPPINVSAIQGKLLQMLAQMSGARLILEIGTLGGYSAIWLARALPSDGRLVTVEINPAAAEVARRNIARAGLQGVVDLRVLPAQTLLAEWRAGEHPAFDFVFLDADRPHSVDLLAAVLDVSHSGTVIVVDNVVRRGAVADAATADADVQGIRRLHDFVAADSRLSATAIQTVGQKGHDGFALLRVR